MKNKHNFITDNFLLHTPLAERLFHEVASKLPILDFHNHVNPHHLATNKNFNNITELWVDQDPYKHRTMRINGVAEHFITGEASDKEKFIYWAETLPSTIGNPLFHWSYLELKRVFDFDEWLNEHSAQTFWTICNEKLLEEKYSVGAILQKWRVEILCTSDDWLDSLTLHAEATSATDVQVYPSLRADSAFTFTKGNYVNFLKRLSSIVTQPITTLDELKAALILRLSYFNEHGCCLADHALDAGFTFTLPSEHHAHQLFDQLLQSGDLSGTENIQLQSYLLSFLGQEYAKLGWTMQLHIGAQRYTSSRLRKLAGAAGGYAGIGQNCDINSLCLWMDHLEKHGHLPRIILYALNPADYAPLATLMGSFTEEQRPGKIQLGPAWWYNDHLAGIQDQLTTVANYGLLSHFIGMTTDSRSILSFSRHEYFRRILCNLIAEWVDKDILPDDTTILEELITKIVYKNTKEMIFHGK